MSSTMNTQVLTSVRGVSPAPSTGAASVPFNSMPVGTLSNTPVNIRTQRLSSAPPPTVSLGTGTVSMGTGTYRSVSPAPGGAAFFESSGYDTLSTMQGQIRQLSLALSEERQQRMMLQAQLSACLRRLDKLDPPETPLQAAVRMVERRGNIRVNHNTGHVTLLRRLEFQPRTTKDEPSAVFRDPDAAEAICKDLAEISNIFNSPMTIEGHTKGGESEFWQTLANRRARVVAETMIDFGANPGLLHTQGLPGRLGRNEVRTEVYMDIRNIKDEVAAVQEVDIITANGQVQREYIQAGHVVERDVIKPAAVIERDVVVGGRVVERDFMVSAPVVERNFVGVNGTTVETQMGRQAYRPVSPINVVRPNTIMG